MKEFFCISHLNIYLPMVQKIIAACIAFCLSITTWAQVSNTGMVDQMDTVENGKISISGYIDVYGAYDFSQTQSGERLYAVSSSRHNEFNINLAYIDLKYRNDKVRARFIPGFGTYMNANYSTEAGSLKNIVEANVGVKLGKKRDIWLDIGVLGSPFTNESAISKDHLMYTRSFAPEYVPYYLSGAKLTMPLNKKWNAYLYILNGWQQIADANQSLSVATQVEYRPNNKWLLNWNTYIGNEKSKENPQYGTRYFTDVYAIYNPDGKFSFTACAYIGWQEKNDKISNTKGVNTWWQANIIGKYQWSKKAFVAARLEYFDDAQATIIKPVTLVNGFNTYSTGLCYTLKISNNALFRLEGRSFYSDKKVYLDENNNAASWNHLLISNITVWF